MFSSLKMHVIVVVLKKYRELMFNKFLSCLLVIMYQYLTDSLASMKMYQPPHWMLCRLKKFRLIFMEYSNFNHTSTDNLQFTSLDCTYVKV